MKENQKRTQRRLQLQKDMVCKALGLPEGAPESGPMSEAGLLHGPGPFSLQGAPALKEVLHSLPHLFSAALGGLKLFSLPLDPAGNKH